MHPNTNIETHKDFSGYVVVNIDIRHEIVAFMRWNRLLWEREMSPALLFDVDMVF